MTKETNEPGGQDDDAPLTPYEMRIVNALILCPESALCKEIAAETPLSHQKIGSLLGLSRQRVCDIEKKAVAKLRLEFARRYPKPYP